MSVSYLPRRLLFSGARPEVEWIVGDDAAYHEPFFDETLRRLRRLPANTHEPLRRTPADALETGDVSPGPAAFIFHVSRCGSTLVSRMLGALSGCRSVSEPPVLDDILRAHRYGRSVTPADRVNWFRGAVASLCRSVKGATPRTFVKLDAWHLFELPLVRQAFPHVPFVFVYRSPIEVLVSLMRMPSMATIRGTLTPEQLGISAAERDALGREDLAAAVLGAYYREASAHIAELVPVAYEELPDAVWCDLLGGTLSKDAVRVLKDVAACDAKTPDQPFVADGDAKRRAATPSESAACARWTDEAFVAWTDSIGRRAGSTRCVLAPAARG